MNDQDTVIGSSTTDSAEQIAHAMGKKSEQPATKVAPAGSEEPTETHDASGASERSEELKERTGAPKGNNPARTDFKSASISSPKTERMRKESATTGEIWP